MQARRVIAVGIVAFALVAAGCGDDDSADESPVDGSSADESPADGEGSGEQRREYVEAIVGLADDDDVLDEAERTCVAESYVDGYGPDEMAADGVAPDDIANGELDAPGEIGLDFSQEQADDFYDRLQECLDVRGLIVESAGTGGELPQEAVDCINENLDDDLLERFVVTGFTAGDAGFEDDPELAAEVDDAIAPCMALSGP